MSALLDDTDPAADDATLQTAAELYPDRRFIEIPGGWIAVPADTHVTESTTLNGLLAKLAGQRPDGTGEHRSGNETDRPDT